MEVNDAVSEPALIEKFELRADVVWQGALAASHHDRVQEQMALVDPPRADCRPFSRAQNAIALVRVLAPVNAAADDVDDQIGCVP